MQAIRKRTPKMEKYVGPTYGTLYYLISIHVTVVYLLSLCLNACEFHLEKSLVQGLISPPNYMNMFHILILSPIWSGAEF
jgi:hypothetical protein